MGEAGRRWVSSHWRWDDIAARLARLLDGSAY
jgi:phosphatidylinositol alpha-1,6-mannosyltransferase